MRMTLLVHIVAGRMGLVFGYVALYALPVLAVLVTMLYWVWRVRIRRSYRGLAGVGAREAV